MSVCGQSGQTEDDSGSEEPATTATAAATRDIYKQKPASKVVRVLTVLAYLLSVSLAAILLSVYYVCVWKSPELPPLNDTGAEINAQRAEGHPHQYMPAGGADANFTGGGDSGVNALADPAPDTIKNVFSNGSIAGGGTMPTTDVSPDDGDGEVTTDTTLLPDSLNSTFDSGTNDTDIT